MSTPDRPSAAEVFDEALAVAPEDRDQLIRRRCADDARLEAEVRSLLDHFEASSTFMEGGAVFDAGLQTSPQPPPDGGDAILTPGTRIAAYTVMGILGEGGMGIVYLARQQSPQRDVALKVLRPSMASREMLRRFQRESQMLARLSHPGIAQVYEAGTATLAGNPPQPFFVMELVRGRPLTEFCRSRNLSLPERLEIFRTVCAAVNHAHQRGFIHRDLKPGNILIDDQRQPKILDFGIARPTGAEPSITITADAGLIVGTLAYMSPEQVSGDPLELDIRSDVYALGVILYELLAGKLPYEVRNRATVEAIRIITEHEAPSVRSLDAKLPSDVATITAKALEKDRTRRYQSALELADDLGRFLRNEPILARKPSALYQIHKFSMRHKALVAGAAATVLAIVIGAFATARMAIVAREESAAGQEVITFLTSILTSAEPGRARGRQMTVRETLDIAAGQLSDSTPLSQRPLVLASLHRTVGLAYMNIGELKLAEPHLRKAAQIRTTVVGAAGILAIQSADDLAQLLVEQGNSAEAMELASRTFKVARASMPDNAALLSELLITEASALELSAGPDEAIAAYQAALDARPPTLGDSSRSIHAKVRLASLLAQTARAPESLPLFRAAIQAMRVRHGSEHPATIAALAEFGAVQARLGNLGEAQTLLSQAAASASKVLPPNHPDAIGVTIRLGEVQYLNRQYTAAELTLLPAVEAARRELGRAHHETRRALALLARALAAQDRFPEAEAYALECLEQSTSVDPAAVAEASALLDDLYARWNDPAKLDQWRARRNQPQ